jgi:Tfp pilus assembly ATPase PilU
LYPAAVICEVINDDGSMAKLPDLIEFSKKHNDMKIITIKDLIDYVNAQKSKSSTTNSAGNKEKLNKAEEKNLVYG